MSWDDLRYFLHAAQAGTLAGAARGLGVEHSTVGRRLAALEDALGAALVQRGPEGVSLTPLGEELVPLVEEVWRAVQAVHARAGERKARVRLALPSGFARIFADRLGELRRAHPHLALELISGSRPVDLRRGEADLALRAGPVGDPDLVVKKLGEVAWALYGSRTYLRRHPAVDVDDLAGHEVIGYDASIAGLPAAQWMEARSKRSSIVLRSREMIDMLGAALAHLGLAVLPCQLGDVEPSLRRLSDVVGRRPLALVYRREAVTGEVRAVIDFVAEVLREQAPLLSGRRPRARGRAR